jgi:hypothetical protein
MMYPLKHKHLLNIWRMDISLSSRIEYFLDNILLHISSENGYVWVNLVSYIKT